MDVVGTAERALLAMSALVAGQIGRMVAVVLAGQNERRRELAVLRAVAGAAPVLLMLAAEGALVTLAGVLLGIVLLALTIAALPRLQGTTARADAGSTERHAMGAAGRGAGRRPAGNLVPGCALPAVAGGRVVAAGLSSGLARAIAPSSDRHRTSAA